MAKMEVGQKFIDFDFLTPWSGVKKFSELAEGSKTVVKFLRYYGCRNCQIDIMETEEECWKLINEGVKLFIVLQSAPETLQEAYGDDRPPFVYILDPEMKLYKELEIGDKQEVTDEKLLAKGAARKQKMADLNLVHGKYEGNEQQAPATFVLDKDMTVKYAKYGLVSYDTPETDELVEIVKSF